jgi:hypothetical protein
MRRILSLLALGALLLVPMQPASASPGITLVNVWQSSNASSTTATSGTIAPTPGDVVLTKLDALKTTGCPTVTTPTGWTLAGASACSGGSPGREQTLYYTHIAQSGETSDSITLSVSSYSTVTTYDFGGVNTTTPVDGSPVFASVVGSTSQTPPSITAAQVGDVLVAGNENGQFAVSSVACTTPCVGTFALNANSGSQTIFAGSAYAILSSNSGTLTAPTFTLGGSPSSTYGINSAILLQPAPAAPLTNNLGTAHAGGPHQSIVVTLPLSVPPSRVNTYVYAQYLGSTTNGNTSVAQAANWFHDAEGNQYSAPNGVNNVCLTSNGCQPYIYEVWTDADVNTNGGSSDIQLHSGTSVNAGTCPNNSTAWKTNAQESWYLHAAGTSIASANRIGGLGDTSSTADYYIPTNIGDTSAGGYRQWAQNTIKYCAVNGFPLDGVGSFSDNTDLQLTTDYWVFGAEFFPLGKNIGTGVYTNYANLDPGTCATLFTGATCWRSSHISATTNATMEYRADTGVGGYETDLGNFLCGLKKHDGSDQPVMFNGAKAADTTLATACNQIVGGLNEHQVVNAGVVQPDSGIEAVLDACSAYAGTTKEFVSQQTAAGSTAEGDPIGSANFERNKRVIWGFMGLCFYPAFTDSPSIGTNPDGITCNSYGCPAVGVYPFDFLWPNNPVKSMQTATYSGAVCGQGEANDCNTHGWRDLDSGAPSGLLTRAFKNCYYTPTFVFYAANVANAARVNTGECIFVMNLSGAAVTSAQIQAALGSQWSNVSNIMLPGSPNGSYFTSGAFTTGTTTVCSTTTSCGDVGGTTGGILSGQVGTGPGTLNCSTAKSMLTALADGDAVVYTADANSGCN